MAVTRQCREPRHSRGPREALHGCRNSHAVLSVPNVGRRPATETPLRQGCVDAQMDDGVQIEPRWSRDCDEEAQPAPDFELDRHVNW